MSNPFKNLHRPFSRAPKQLRVLFKETMVRIRLVQDTDTKKVSIQVSVRSNVKQYVWGHLLVDADSTRLEYEVQKAASYIATYQNDLYHDTHNPPAITKAASSGLKDILRAAERASTRTAPTASAKDKAFNG